jgi:hypothetical protein
MLRTHQHRQAEAAARCQRRHHRVQGVTGAAAHGQHQVPLLLQGVEELLQRRLRAHGGISGKGVGGWVAWETIDRDDFWARAASPAWSPG